MNCLLQDLDEDSEAEKLSPLLVSDGRSPETKSRMNSADDSVDDTDEVSFLPVQWNFKNLFRTLT